LLDSPRPQALYVLERGVTWPARPRSCSNPA
jgi:hypothetical protein